MARKRKVNIFGVEKILLLRETVGSNGELFEEEFNIMSDKKLKEDLVYRAIAMLKNAGLFEQGTAYESLKYTKVKFAFLFEIEDEVQGMFRLITDKREFLFVIQNDILLYPMPEMGRMQYEIIRKQTLQELTNFVEVYGDVDNIPWKNVLELY